MSRSYNKAMCALNLTVRWWAAQQGLADINTIATQACHYLKPNGFLILEHGYRQSQSVRTRLQSLGYNAVNTLTDHAGHERVTLGVLPDPMVLE